MATLPLRLTWQLASDRWASIINPVIDNPANNTILLKNIQLTSGNNVVNHKLGRNLQGWSIVRIRSQATVSDTQDTNQTPQLTLNLFSSAPVVVDLLVF